MLVIGPKGVNYLRRRHYYCYNRTRGDTNGRRNQSVRSVTMKSDGTFVDATTRRTQATYVRLPRVQNRSIKHTRKWIMVGRVTEIGQVLKLRGIASCQMSNGLTIDDYHPDEFSFAANLLLFHTCCFSYLVGIFVFDSSFIFHEVFLWV